MTRLLVLLAVLGWAGPAFAADGAQTKVRLLLSHDAARPGETVMAGLELRMPAKTHTYWRNPGEAGAPTEIKWKLPAGVTAGALQGPVPEKFDFDGIVTYGYHGTAVLLAPLKIAADAKPGEVEVAGEVSWLECEESCLPGDAPVRARLTIGGESKPSTHAAALATAAKQLPPDGAGLSATLAWDGPAAGKERAAVLAWNAPAGADKPDFYPFGGEGFEVAPQTTALAAEGGKTRLKLNVTKSGPAWPEKLGGLLVWKEGGGARAAQITASFPGGAGGGPAGAAGQALSAGGAAGFILLLKMMVFGFIGGLILNIMPCVFPVIALKILGFVQQSREAPERVFRLGLFYALGVLASFLALAAVVIAVQQAGGAASWGMQMQNPQFTLLLTTVVVLVALSLFGVFEINLSGRALDAAGQLTGKEGAGGAFMNGVLATVLATPCTAPFLAPALGFAFAQSPGVIVVMFVAVAAGLAAPYIVLSWRPQWLKLLPRPGAWMEKFKIVMGFPMLATAIWLFSFAARRFGPDGPLWVGLFLVNTALAAWIWGDFVQRGRARRGLGMAVSLLVFAAGYGWALEKELAWRAPARTAGATTVAETKPGGIPWRTWSADAVAAARAAGRVVLVDFTAEYCLTCKWNKRNALEVPEVIEKLKALDAVALLGDNTDSDPAIVAELKRFGRAGVPLVLVYPRRADAEALVLPALLTKNLVLDALSQAAQ